MAHTPRLSYGHRVYHDAGRDHIEALDGLDGAFEATLAGPVRTTSELVQQQALFARVRCSDLFRLAIGLLSDAAARAALVEPLAAHGEGIDADALATVVKDSQRYPYFIQLWGEALWKRLLATGATRLTAAHAAAARPDVVARVTDYYEDRYLELDQSGWLAAAERVAARFQSMPTLTYEELKSAIAAGLAAHAEPGQIYAALNALQRLGFVWRPARTASAGPLRAWYPLADGPRARPHSTGARSAPARQRRRRKPRRRASLGPDRHSAERRSP